ncbi:hypothetical protein CQ056_11080 [Peribacillus simplex]|nr:hypothetical protein CQ056_11080 [Peribacillus simplex]
MEQNRRYEAPAGKAWPRETPQASAEGGPPAESECLDWKSTIRITNLQKNVRVIFRSPLPNRSTVCKAASKQKPPAESDFLEQLSIIPIS